MSRSIKPTNLVCIVLLATTLLNLVGCTEPSLESKLDGVDARQALAIADRWFQERQPVKSFINTYEIVFEFQDGKKRIITLPAEEMMVAIAPYVQKTHA